VFVRKWLVRGLVFSVLGGALALGLLYQRLTDPATVRRQVLARLRQMFPWAEVSLESARLRLLGGIALGEVRLARRDDPDQAELAYLPSAVLFHDKEQLLGGALVIRKVELHRPRLRLVRNPQGKWNLVGVTTAEGAAGPLPTLVVQQGTVILEDQLSGPGCPPVEITDVNLTLVNDTASTLTFEGSGRSDLVGPVQLRGQWRRPEGELRLAIRASRVPVGPALLQRLRALCPADRGSRIEDRGSHTCRSSILDPRSSIPAWHLEGVASIRATFHYRGGPEPVFQYDIHCRLAQGKVRHPNLPFPLEQVDAAFHCQGGKWDLEQASARAGLARLKLTDSWVRLTPAGADFRVQGLVEHLGIGPKLFHCLPQEVKPFEALYHPAGPATVAFTFCRRGAKWLEQHCVIRPEGMSGSFQAFPYLVERFQGTLDADLLARSVKVDLTGYTGSRPVTIRGAWQGAGEQAAGDLTIRGKDIPLDNKLLAALPPAYRQLARSFHLTGQGDFDVRIRHHPGQATLDNHYRVWIHDGKLKWDQFPYPLQRVAGTLDIWPSFWELRGFRGKNQGGEFRAWGRSYPGARPGSRNPVAPAGDRVAIRITGRNVRLDGRDMQAALVPFAGLSKSWHTLRPAGRMDFTAKIDRLPRQPQDLDVTVDVKACSVHPLFFNYRLDDVQGRFRYAQGLVRMDRVRARHGDSAVELPHGEIKLYPGGGLYAVLTDLRADPLVLDAGLKRALPGPLKKACQALGLKDPLALKTKLVVALAGEPESAPDIFWDGEVRLRDAAFRAGIPVRRATGRLGCRGRHNGNRLLGVNAHLLLTKATVYNQPFHDIHTKIDIFEETPDVLILGFQAPLFGGQVSGPGRVELTSTLRYELDLTASEIDLEKFSKHNISPDSGLSGLVSGRLHLVGTGAGLSNLEANGSLDMPRGRLYNLPLVLDLLKFLGLRWPDRTAFDQAHAAFSIHGDRVHFSQLELFGNAVSLHGQGDMNLNGSDIRLDFIPVWGRIEQILPPVWNDLPSTIGKNLFKIEMRGNMAKPDQLQFHKILVPGLLDPLVQMRDRLTSTLAPRTRPEPKPAQETSSDGR
jgi:hypothetical protein